jgi:tetratricopeptide (TPR) repeat protein
MTRLSLLEMTRAPRDVRKPHAFAHSLVVRLIAVAACASLSVSSAVAQGQERSQDVPGYRSAISEALAEYAAQNYLEAMTLFTRAHELSPNARTLRGLGAVAFELHRYSDCVSYLEQALVSAAKQLEGELRADTENLLARARGFVAKIVLTTEPDSAHLLLDGEPLPRSANGALLLDIGRHELELSAPGHETQRRSYTVVGGEEQSWKVSLFKEGRVSPTSGVDSAPLLGWHRGLSAVAIGLGTAAFVSAAILTAQRHTEGNRYRSVAPEDARYPTALQTWEDARAKPYALAGIGAIAFASGATALLLKAPNRRAAAISAGISAAVGMSVAAWGAVNLLRGSECPSGSSLRQLCSDELERRDRGAITLVSAFPLVVAPLTLLFREWLGHPRMSPSVAVWSGPDPRRSSLLLNLRGCWL